MVPCLFVSDLHGALARYRALFRAVAAEKPTAVLFGGDLLPGWGCLRGESGPSPDRFLSDFLIPELRILRHQLGDSYPRMLIILGNDDPATAVAALESCEREHLCEHIHGKSVDLEGFHVLGYACVPPTPFLLKDWERYDVSRYVDPGCVSPEEGFRTVPVSPSQLRYGTIARDLESLIRRLDPARTVLLSHTPPYRTGLDRADLDGRSHDGVPLELHTGSVAVRRFIEAHQPWLTLHGHVHESTRITGMWQDTIGRTPALSAAHDGPDLAVVRFDLEHPEDAFRELLPCHEP